jgi:hypothetical protein
MGDMKKGLSWRLINIGATVQNSVTQVTWMYV